MTAHRPTPIPAVLRKPLLACLVALAISMGLAVATNQLRRDAEATRDDLSLRLNGIRLQHEATLKDAADARLAFRQLAELDKLGLKSAVPRLLLMGGIDAALAETGLSDLHYTLPPLQPLDDTPLLGLSTVRLEGSVPHEAHLLALLKRLEATNNGLFLPLRCTLARSKADALTIVKADCEATWLGLQPPA